MEKNIWFEKKLLRSSVFRSLSRWSLLVYFDFLRKRQMDQLKSAKRSDSWIIRNNGEIVYPYSEAKKKGIGRRVMYLVQEFAEWIATMSLKQPDGNDS